MCSGAVSTTTWQAVYYIDLDQATSFDFTMDLFCTGPDLFPVADDLLGVPLLDWFLFVDIDNDGAMELFGGPAPDVHLAETRY